MMRAPILALLLLAAAASVSGRDLLQNGNPTCPLQCASDGCVRDTTGGGYRCVKCVAGSGGNTDFIVMRDTGRCGCPKGKYGTATGCADCPQGSYCPGGEATSNSAPYTPLKYFCDATDAGGQTEVATPGATTLGTRAISQQQCVNKAGYSWNSATLAATACSGDSYSTGLKKQPACTPCPPGFKVTGSARTNATACVVPAGSYLKSPGQVALCPKGEYRESGTTDMTKCIPCAQGVTTTDINSTLATDCKVLEKGYYAETMGTGTQITLARLCPMGYVCAGGTPSGQAGWVPTPGTVLPPTGTAGVAAAAGAAICANGRWTRGLGAVDATECMVPPGFGADASSITKCGDALYREGWSSASSAPCLYCSGLAATQTPDFASSLNTGLTLYTGSYTNGVANTATVMVRASRQGSCYIAKGQGVYQTGSDTFRVTDCKPDRYGVSDTTYGVSVNPCRDCPANMVTGATPPDSAVGFFNITQCKTQAGWGYNGRVSTKCPTGYWAAGGDQAACTWCGYGLTTTLGAIADAAADCILLPGYGYDAAAASKAALCPAGKYFAGGVAATAGNECANCTTGSTTADEGAIASSECTYCAAGYGGNTCGECAANTYGVENTPKSAYDDANCYACPTMANGGYAFTYLNASYAYEPSVISSAASKTRGDCLAEFTQAVDDASFINTTLTAATSTTPSGANAGLKLTACVGTCTTNCMLVTYDYAANNCKTYDGVATTVATTGPVVAWKVAPGGSVIATAGERTKAESLASGRYTFWGITYNSNAVGTFPDATAAAGGASILAAACLQACDDSATCAGVTYTAPMTTTAAVCYLIPADTTVTNKRSLTRTVLTQLTVPTS